VSLQAIDGGLDSGVRLVDDATGKVLVQLGLPEASRSDHIAISPDGTQVIHQSRDYPYVYAWDLRTLRRHLDELRLDWAAPAFPEAPSSLPEPLSVQLVGVELTDPHVGPERDRQKNVLALFLNPFDADVHLHLGRQLMETGPPESAFAHLTAALTFDPNLDEACLPRAQAAFLLHRWSEAAADATRYLERHADEHGPRLLRARTYQMAGRFQEAVDDYTALIAHYAFDPQLYEFRAICLDALGDTDRARADHEKAVALVPPDSVILDNYAWWLVTGPAFQRDPAWALKLIEARVKRYPPDGPLLQDTLGVAQYRNGHYAEALQTLEKCLALAKDEVYAHDLFFLAMCHARLGAPVKARERFDQAVDWCDEQDDLSASDRRELNAFRAEAETALGLR
jgi:Flp pilus assembly protein TadD